MKKREPRLIEERKLAVALRYDGEGAPRVTAKGAGELGERIIKVAEEHGVPLRANRELVGLLAQLELDQQIPEVLYRVVAEIIAYAYWVKSREPTATTGED
ncbi:EscU/YscU/HrcU family type III secretion system export apparatus switch protein [Alkalilimnicola sp. S0819]|uniref:EscU/YscU/HrcU family type III secretion system export apparatus switch protein n=1 Tax=Alkalilimnicola sp. S0819 TaxID=2613922 RepID=UPI0012625A1A|nr:EscU/YscU/HrcU family type III secretion system export apparatus switch protein [Alkalilimnicola sp. S0819]KAB7627155.1 flagellar protein FhlB [Alkalilimnicola sp. S0819]MPQ15864.1 flagellar protein FhlB [Alkalilimnicola sp. S0819]